MNLTDLVTDVTEETPTRTHTRTRVLYTRSRGAVNGKSANNRHTRHQRLPKIERMALKIQEEYEQSVVEVVAGYFADGESMRSTAEILGVSVKSLGCFAREKGLPPPRVPSTLKTKAAAHRANIRAAARRRHRRISYNGETLSAIEWAERFNLPRDAIVKRIRRGWSVESALRTPTLNPSEVGRARVARRWRKTSC